MFKRSCPDEMDERDRRIALLEYQNQLMAKVMAGQDFGGYDYFYPGYEENFNDNYSEEEFEEELDSPPTLERQSTTSQDFTSEVNNKGMFFPYSGVSFLLNIMSGCFPA